jgi:hypothetical protein
MTLSHMHHDTTPATHAARMASISNRPSISLDLLLVSDQTLQDDDGGVS